MDVLSRAAAWALAAAIAPVAACSPEIGRGTYFCGPERLCPPGQECDDSTYTCETPALVKPFSCPGMSELFEPDDILDQAHDLGALRCGAAALEASLGCLPDIDDVDYLVFEHEAECAGADPHLEISLSYPVALVPIQVELLDADQEVIAGGEICTESGDFTGTEKLCLEASPPLGTYYVRIRTDEDGPDCDGECHHNQYGLAVRFPLS